MKLKTYVKIIQALGENTKCTRKEVGAILVKGDRIISTGYNGLPSGSDDSVCKKNCKGCSLTVHAEMNAILFAAKSGVSTLGSDLYVTYSPCLNCAKHIINAGIKNVYFLEMYEKPEGVKSINLLAAYCDNVYQIYREKGEKKWRLANMSTVEADLKKSKQQFKPPSIDIKEVVGKCLGKGLEELTQGNQLKLDIEGSK
jgi:dCMP deaminase